MNITWHGLSCVRLEGKDAVVVVDPVDPESGLKTPRFQADIVCISSDDMDPEAVSGEPFVVDIPGEYEAKNVFIYALPWRKEKDGSKGILYRFQVEDITVAHVAALDRVVPNAALEILEGVDVLILPIGNHDSLSVKQAAEIISRIEPRVVVGIDYAVDGLKLKRQAPEPFLKELGMKAERTDKLKLSKKDLPTEDRKIYILEKA